jgi:hypothetical protein
MYFNRFAFKADLYTILRGCEGAMYFNRFAFKAARLKVPLRIMQCRHSA